MGNTSLVPKARKAAMYVRMSTEMQQYSTQNQADAIQQYAANNNFTIISKYEDNGRSGLALTKRKGLSDLLKEVQSGSAAFRDILVYDISRWGRFQDVDESAFYDHLCKRAGVTVHYCAEQFQNDGSVASALLKAIKRSMAGEYSRELSVKVFAGQSRLIQMGFRQGGSAGFGYRRKLIDGVTGKEKGVLQHGDHKYLQTDRIVLIPGPDSEVETVREIFDLFTIGGHGETHIARLLNEHGVQNDRGGEWKPERVKWILQNPKYIGSNLYYRTSVKLLQKRVFIHPSKWIRRDDAFEALVSVSQFEQAQRIFAARKLEKYSNEQLLENLKALWARKGKLTGKLIAADRSLPKARAVQERFEGLTNAYRLIGYQAFHDRSAYDAVKAKLRLHHAEFYARIKSDFLSIGATAAELAKDFLLVNDQFTITISVSYCYGSFTRPRWTVNFRPTITPDFIVMARMNLTNEEILDYYILPVIDRPLKRFSLGLNNTCRYDVYRFDNLSHLMNLARRSPIGYL